MPLTTRFAITGLILCLIAACVVIPENRVWHKSQYEIEEYLLQQTPIGSREKEVMNYLSEMDMLFDEPWRGDIDPKLEYPPSSIYGSSFIRALAKEYGAIFTASVEAYYIFDLNRKLIEISVRKTTDAI